MKKKELKLYLVEARHMNMELEARVVEMDKQIKTMGRLVKDLADKNCNLKDALRAVIEAA